MIIPYRDFKGSSPELRFEEYVRHAHSQIKERDVVHLDFSRAHLRSTVPLEFRISHDDPYPIAEPTFNYIPIGGSFYRRLDQERRYSIDFRNNPDLDPFYVLTYIDPWGEELPNISSLYVAGTNIHHSKLLFDYWLSSSPEGDIEDVILSRIHDDDILEFRSNQEVDNEIVEKLSALIFKRGKLTHLIIGSDSVDFDDGGVDIIQGNPLVGDIWIFDPGEEVSYDVLMRLFNRPYYTGDAPVFRLEEDFLANFEEDEYPTPEEWKKWNPETNLEVIHVPSVLLPHGISGERKIEVEKFARRNRKTSPIGKTCGSL